MRLPRKIRPLAAIALAVLSAAAHAALQKNTAGQGFYLFDYDTTNNAPKTGDAANLTVYRSLDGGTATAITGSVTEVSATSMPGIYWVSVSQADTNGNLFAFYGISTTSGCRCDPFVGATNATQTGDSYARVSLSLPAVAAGSDGGLPILSNGTVGANLKFIAGNSATSSGNVTFPSTISSLTAAGAAAAVWQDPTASADFSTVGSIGKLVTTDLDTSISSRSTFAAGGSVNVTQWGGAAVTGMPLPTSAYTVPPTAAAIATSVWQDLTSSADFTTAGSAGKLIVTDLDTNVGSRLAASSYSAPASTSQIAAAILRTPANLLTTDTSGDVTFNNSSIATVTTTTNLTNLPAIPTGWITATGISASALNGKGDWLLSSSYTAPDNADIGSILTNTTQLPNLVTGTGVNAQFSAKALALAPGSTGALTTDQDTKLTDIYTQTAAIIAGKVEARSPLLQNGTHLVLVRGDDYTQAAGQPLEWTDTGGNWPDLTGATVTLTIRAKNKDGSGGAQLLQTTGTYIAGTPKKIRIEPTAAATDALSPGNRVNVFDVRATLSGGQVVTLVRGENTVLEDETR